MQAAHTTEISEQIYYTAHNNNNNNNNNKSIGIETTDKWYTHVPKPVYEEGDVTVLWNQEVHTDREVTANRRDIIIKNKKEKTCTLIDVAIPADKCCAKGSRKEVKIQEFMYRYNECGT